MGQKERSSNLIDRRNVLKLAATSSAIGLGLPATADQAEAATSTISNDNIIVYIDDAGNFTMQTADGEDLMYAGGSTGTSFLTVQVDGTNYVTGRSMGQYLTGDTTFGSDPPTATTNWVLPEGIEVTQTISLAGQAARFQLEVENTDSVDHEVNIRYLFDYQVGIQDGAPIFVNGDVITNETRYESPGFDTWQTYDQLPNPGLTGRGTFGTVPDRIEFVAWEDASNTDYTYGGFDPDKAFYTPGSTSSPASDSAALIYWEFNNVLGGESVSVSTFYGVGQPTERGLSELEDAFVSLETSVGRYLSETLQARARAYAVPYKNYGSEFSDDILNYYGYIAGEVSEENVSEEVREALDPEIKSQISTEDALTFYRFHEELFGELSQSESVSELTQTVNEFLRGIHPNQTVTIQIDDQTYDEFQDDLVSSISDRRQEFIGLLSARTGIDRNVLNSLIDCINEQSDLISSYASEAVDEINKFADIFSQDIDSNNITGSITTINAGTGSQQNMAHPGGVINKAGSVSNEQLSMARPAVGSPEPELAVLSLSAAIYGVVGIIKVTGASAAAAATTTKGMVILGGAGALGAGATFLTTQSGAASATTGIVGTSQALSAGKIVHSAWYFNLYYAGLTSLNQIGTQIQSFLLRRLRQELKEKLTELVNRIANEALQEAVEELCRQNQTIQEIDVSDIGPLDALTSGGEILEARQTGSVEIKNTGEQVILPDLSRSYITSQDGPGKETQVGYITVDQDELKAIGPGETDTIEFSYTVPVGFLCGRYKINLVVDSFLQEGATLASPSRDFAFFKATGLAPCLDDLDFNILGDSSILQGNSESYQPATNSTEARTTYTLSYGGSDLDLHVYDTQGNHVGQNYDTGEFEAEIQGAEYSGPDSGAGLEGIEIPPGVQAAESQVIALETDEDGVNYTVDSSSVPQSPAELRLFPNSRTVSGAPNRPVTTSLSVREIAGFEALTGVSLSANTLTQQNGEETIPESTLLFSDNGFDVDAGESRSISVIINVPRNTLPGSYVGTLSATSDESEQSEEIPLTISVRFDVVQFDRDGDGQIGFTDLRFALREYNRGNITFDQLRRVLQAYNTGESVGDASQEGSE